MKPIRFLMIAVPAVALFAAAALVWRQAPVSESADGSTVCGRLLSEARAARPKPPLYPKRVLPKKPAKIRVVKPAKKVVGTKPVRFRRVTVIPPRTVVNKTVVVGSTPTVVTKVEKKPQAYYVPAALTTTKNVELAAYFTPGDGPKKAALAELGRANKVVYVAMHEISDAELINALVSACKRGVAVSVLADADTASSCQGVCEKLAEGGVDVRLASAPGGMNNAFAVIDRSVLLVGSYNWTEGACEERCENMLLVRNSAVATHYANIFEGLWSSPEETAPD